MIRFDQRSFDAQATERVYRKVIHPSKNLHMVDKDGIPLRAPNTASLSRLHSTYMLSPRGVPTRKTTHAYSGQLAQGKMQNLVNTMDTQSHPEFNSYVSMLNYNNNSGLSSAGSSRPPMQVTSKQRAFGSGPPRSVKSMPTKSASSQRSRYLTSATTTDLMSQDADGEKSNDSPQGKRIEKEWSALSQCRAMKRSSEILSHRVDRMYFMTGNKLKIASKFHVEDDELQHLRALSQARASSRASRSTSRRGDVYHPDMSFRGSFKSVHGENGGYVGHMNGVVGTEDGHKVGRHDRQKENKEPKPIVSQKALTPKPSSRKSPIQGWGSGDPLEKDGSVENEMVRRKSLHDEEKSEVGGDAPDGAVAGNAEGDNSDVKAVDETDEAAPECSGYNNNDEGETAQVEMDNEKQTANVPANNVENGDINGENAETKDAIQADTDESPKQVTQPEGDANETVDNKDSEEQNKDAVDNVEEKLAGEIEESVQRSDTNGSDKDRIDVKSEEYLERTITDDNSLQEKN